MPENPVMGQEQSQDIPPMPNMDSEEQPVDDNSGESEFDTNFDAGVEADEDEDPKKYIQQLTGKLSQELNKFNNENGNDEELSKYVGKMIAKAAAKGLDEKGKKELIKSINTTESNDEEDLEGGEEIEDVETEVPTEGGGEEITDIEQEQPIEECGFSKQELMELAESVRTIKNQKRNPFKPKEFNK